MQYSAGELQIIPGYWEGEVQSNSHLTPFIREIIIRLPEDRRFNFRSGSYIQLDIPACEINLADIVIEEQYLEDWEQLKAEDMKMKNPEATFRAYSLANYPAENNIIKLIVRIALPPMNKEQRVFLDANAGIGSSWLFSRQPGDTVNFSGPYGDFFIKESNHEIILVAGGTGMAPMHSHVLHLFRTLSTRRKVSFWYGARSERELFYEDEFREIESAFPGFTFHVTLYKPLNNPEWHGSTGFIDQVIFENYLAAHPKPEEIEYYLCGPSRMHDAMFRMLGRLGVPEEMIDFDDFGGSL